MDTNILEFTEKMYRPIDLHYRWPSLRRRELALGIDDSINAANSAIANKPEAMTDFPKPYWHIATRYSQDGEEITSCIPCEKLFLKNGEYERPYGVRKKENKKGNIYNFKRILFKKADVIAYETRHTDNEGYFIFGESEDDIEIVVPQKLFAGKTPRKVIEAMSAPEYDFDPKVIAYVLHTWCGQTNMIELGRMLKKDGGQTESAYSKHARKLLTAAEEMDISFV